jgi:nucleoid-associated protein YgaU
VGNFEKLSVLVIVVIIVMILVVAIYEWTGSPSDTPTTEPTATGKVDEAIGAGGNPSASATSTTGANEDITKVFEMFNPPAVNVTDPLAAPGAKPATPKAPGAAVAATPGTGTPGTGTSGTATPAAGAAATTESGGEAPAALEYAETTHVVAAGESLSEIAQKHWKRASYYTKIVDANPGLDPMRLRVGQKLKIPALKIEAPALAKDASGAKRSGSKSSGSRAKPGDEYTVRSGDTWETIAKDVYDSADRWPEIYMKNMNKTGMKDLRQGLVILLPK